MKINKENDGYKYPSDQNQSIMNETQISIRNSRDRGQ